MSGENRADEALALFERMQGPGGDRAFPVIGRLPKRIREDILLVVLPAPSGLGRDNRLALVAWIPKIRTLRGCEGTSTPRSAPHV